MSSSVVLCTYNGRQFLAEQLDSILTQSRRVDQIILSDDGSTDGTMRKLEWFAARARKLGIDVILQRHSWNLGFVGNFQSAMQLATSDIVFLCDQDDVWHKEKLALTMNEFERRPDLTFLHTDAQLIDESGNALGYSLFDALALRKNELAAIHSGDAFSVLYKRSVVTGATAAFRLELLAQALPIPTSWYHDEWLALVASVVGRVDIIEQAMIDYRQHANNQIGMRKRTWRDRWTDVMRPLDASLRSEIVRSDELNAWLAAVSVQDVDAQRLKVATRRLHFVRRLRFGEKPRVLRWLAIVREWRAGKYALYSNGVRSLFRDACRNREKSEKL